MHPYVIDDVTGKKTSRSCCSTTTGLFACKKDDVKNDMDNLGLGISTYFKILKAFMITLFVIIVINSPLYAIYFLNNPERSMTTYLDGFFKTTLGNMASGKNQ